MYDYICRTVTENPGYMQALLRVPTNTTIFGGQVFKAEILADNVKGVSQNLQVYEPEEISSPFDMPVIVLNNNFETLEDGRRPSGQPNYTKYTFKEGQVITAERLFPGLKFELSIESIENYDELVEDIDSALNTYLYINDGNKLLWTDDIDEVDAYIYLQIEAFKKFRIGGQFGDEAADTMVVRVKNKKVNPFITDLTATIEEGLKVGETNVDIGALVATFTTTGGTSPYTYELVEDTTYGVDNDNFAIVNNTLTVGENALTVAKTYKVYVGVEDANGRTFEKAFEIVVAPADEITG